MPVQFDQKSFTVGANDASSAENYRNNFDRIFRRRSPQVEERQGQDQQAEDHAGDDALDQQDQK